MQGHSQDIYKAMIEAMRDMVYMCTPDYHLQYLNPAMRDRIGRDAVGEICHKAIYRRDTPCPWCAGMPPPGHTVQCETTCPETGRTSRIACATMGDAEARLVIVSDITDHRMAELELQESETRYKRLVASVTDYIYTVKIENGQAVSTFHGPGCIAVTGYSTADYENDPDLWYKMVHTEDRERVLDQTAQLIEGQAIQPFEHRIIHKNGHIRWVRNTPVPHRNALGMLVSYDGMITDITERKLAEAQISDHTRKLEIINRITIAVNKADNLASMLDEMLNSSLDLLQFHSGCIYLMNENSRTAEMRCASCMPADFINRMAQIDRDHDEAGFLIDNGQAVFHDNCYIAAPAMARRWNFAALARMPLMSKDQTIGMLVIASGQPHHFSENERELLQSIARQMGTALAKTRSEIALRESENRYRTITEQSLVGIQIIQAGRLIFIN
ncbi:MAG: PAS domain S-box protein, partial [Lentisphaerae bacterium]|nr:PAS domain S-box protein [Lentisphaerota bacterium]